LCVDKAVRRILETSEEMPNAEGSRGRDNAGSSKESQHNKDIMSFEPPRSKVHVEVGSPRLWQNWPVSSRISGDVILPVVLPKHPSAPDRFETS
jgi:hypothetical protein